MYLFKYIYLKIVFSALPVLSAPRALGLSLLHRPSWEGGSALLWTLRLTVVEGSSRAGPVLAVVWGRLL